jgi:putative hemolysin
MRLVRTQQGVFSMKSILVFLLSLPVFVMAGGSSTVGPANPSSVYCRDQKGFGIAVDENGFGGGQFGLCRLSDNSMIEEWTFFRQQSQESLAMTYFRKGAWHTYENAPIEQWAKLNCEELQGEIIEATEHLRPSLRYQVCKFSDRSIIEAWTLMSGPGMYPELGKR